MNISHNISHYIGNADEFPILEHRNFFNHAGVSPLPRCAGDALRQFAQQYESYAYLDSGFYKAIEALRVSAAAMINAHRDEIAFIKNTSEGIATVASGIDWLPGDRIVTSNVEYPANMYPWMDVAKRFGAELITVPEVTAADGSRSVPLDALLKAADHPRTRLLALSHVEYASGQRHDLATIGQFCRQRNILFCVDAIQSMGVLPLDVRGMNIDYLAADGHKWLLGPEGAGVFFCRRELLANTRPLSIGWMNVINDQDYGHYDLTLKSDARRFECGTHNLPGLLAFKASLELLLNLGVQAVSQRLRTLTDRLCSGLNEKGYNVISPRGAEQWSGIVSFTSAEQQRIFQNLRINYQTEIALREGRLRVSAHFYNTEAQIDRLLADISASGSPRCDL